MVEILEVAKSMKDKACKDCEWYLLPNKDGSRKERDLAECATEQELLPCGFCVRYPPMKAASFERAGWVIVQEDDYCGEFVPKR